jgi:hypothetical protein
VVAESVRAGELGQDFRSALVRLFVFELRPQAPFADVEVVKIPQRA